MDHRQLMTRLRRSCPPLTELNILDPTLETRAFRQPLHKSKTEQADNSFLVCPTKSLLAPVAIAKKLSIHTGPMITHLSETEVNKVADRVADRLQLGERLPSTNAAMPAGGDGVPLPTAELPEVQAIMAEPGFEERVRTCGIKVAKTVCLTI